MCVRACARICLYAYSYTCVAPLHLIRIHIATNRSPAGALPPAPPQRPKKSQLSRWQLSTRKNFLSRRSALIVYMTKKHVNHFRHKISSLSGNFPCYLETFQAVQKLSRSSRKYPVCQKIFQMVQFQGLRAKKFPDAQRLPGWQHKKYQIGAP